MTKELPNDDDVIFEIIGSSNCRPMSVQEQEEFDYYPYDDLGDPDPDPDPDYFDDIGGPR